MEQSERLKIYLRQVGEQKYVDGFARLTARQRKRIALKDHKRLGPIGFVEPMNFDWATDDEVENG